jgi:hypothetical protein
MNHYVYLIEQRNALPNEAKYYIGVRSCECKIGDDPYYGSSKYLKEEVNKQGLNNFNKIILKRFENRKDALEYEVHLHKEFDVANNVLFFNKAKQTSVKFTPGVGINNFFFGKTHTKENIEKIRLANLNSGTNKGVPKTMEHKQKISESLVGIKKPQLSQKLKGRKLSEETKKKLSQAGKKRMVSDSTKEKLRNSALKQWQKAKGV